ncbi:chaoptin-like, partial [Diaphorina citri]|uniref:Chaoptin-like n=1 Tax=Diaphorina citri TaxID=121845 RepID=A0A3Q0JJ64_DIACI
MTNQIATIQHRAFMPLSNMLRYLDLSYNQLDEVPHEALQALKNLDWLNLHSNQIAELETANWSPEIQNKLTTLFIGENHIHQIENLNGFRSILWLNMDSNLLQTLDSLPKTMETLSVANNYLVNYLELNRMTSLKWIVLSNNYIKEFVIPNRKHIEKLDLSNNLISTINLNLNNTYYIKDLILSYNQISKLNANTFRNLNVFRLYLKFNKISEIHDFAFNGLNSTLEFLDLENNRLTNINQCFRNLKKLKYLYLHNNNIEFIQNNTFEHLVNLKSISLSGNKLTRIPDFIHNKRLSHLNLGYNFLNELILESSIVENEIIDQNMLFNSNAGIMSEDEQYVNDEPINERTSHGGPILDETLNVNSDSIIDEYAPNHDTHERIKSKTTESYSNKYTDSLNIINDELKTPRAGNHRQRSQIENIEQMTLDLSHNKLSVLNMATLYSNVTKLQHLGTTILKGDQLQGIFNSKLRELEITGKDLKFIDPSAFDNIDACYDLTLKITNTQIEELPSGLFDKIENIEQMTLDLSHNKLSVLNMATLYSNVTKLQHLGTTILKAKNLNSKINVQQFSFPGEQHTHKTNPDSNDEKTYSYEEKYNRKNKPKFEIIDYYDDITYKYSERRKRSLEIDDLNNSNYEYSTDKTINRINDRTHVKRRRYKHYNDHNYNKYVRYKKNIISTNKTLDDEDTVDKNRYKNSINDINSKKSIVKAKKNNNNNEDQVSDREKLLSNLETLLLRCNKITDLNGNLFRHLYNLQELSLSFNKLQIIELNSNVFDVFEKLQLLEISFSLFNSNEFPYYILNKNLNTLEWLAMDNNNIKNIRNYSLYNLTSLNYINLEYNKISKIHNNLFHFNIHKRLKEIRLSNNYLELIESDTFYNLKELNTITLSYNLLKSIKTTSFKNLNNMLNIVLSFNQIKYIYPNAFVNLPNLVKLDLQDNKLKDFNLNVFSNITSKQTPMNLNLSNNYITNLYENDKKQAPIYIKSLDLSNNRIQEVPVNFLQTFADSLRKLYLDFNEIKHLDATAFGNLDVLELLSLEHNNIAVVVKRTFIGMPNLQIIDLSFNEISMLTGEQFYFSFKLRILNISHNRLRSLPRDVFSNTIIEKLDISYNQDKIRENVQISCILLMRMESELHTNILQQTVRAQHGNAVLECDQVATPGHHYSQSAYKEYLYLSNTNLNSFPHLPLPDLLILDMSNNNIDSVTENCAELLGKLRRLNLSGNQIQAVPSNIWSSVPFLKELDLSNNPIRLITKDSFSSLHRLQSLNVQHLPKLERFDSDSLLKNVFLQNLKIQTWPKIEKYRFRLSSILGSLHSLKKVSVDVQEVKL